MSTVGLPTPSPLTVFQQAQALGYEHLLFISWPHMIELGGERIVRSLKQSIEDRLRNEGIATAEDSPHPVFLDKPSLDPSLKWEPRIRQALCRSVSTLVMVLPTYFQSRFCALEWGITDALQNRRLGSSTETCFLLLPFHEDTSELPPAARQLNFLKSFDRKRFLAGGKFTERTSWKGLIDEVIGEMRKITKRVISTGRPDWEREERIAKEVQPFAFFPPQTGGGTPPASGAIASFPMFRVEGRAA